ncbi:ParB N-terminal domain-containing protein [Candidatus Gracilibacteria bacterium]|nr:ParB N-terminal domain-containing protein [Candidatus Gracilibacteria bacterium]
MQIKNINIKDLKLNSGQIKDVPKNPRFIKNERFEALKKSIQEFPEMLEYREIVVYDNNGEYVIIGGNMRYRACKELGYKEITCKVFPVDTSAKKLREFVVKDNREFGADDFDMLANEWEMEELLDWGFEEFEFGGDVVIERLEEDEGMGITDKFQLILDFENENELKKEYNKLKNLGYKCFIEK